MRTDLDDELEMFQSNEWKYVRLCLKMRVSDLFEEPVYMATLLAYRDDVEDREVSTTYIPTRLAASFIEKVIGKSFDTKLIHEGDTVKLTKDHTKDPENGITLIVVPPCHRRLPFLRCYGNIHTRLLPYFLELLRSAPQKTHF